MADSDAHTGFGALILKGDGASPENFVAIMGVKSITGPNISRDTHDTTDMQSESGYREFIGGLTDAGEVQFEANLLPRNSTQNQEEGGFMAEFDRTSCDSKSNYRVQFPECEGEAEGYMAFKGIVTGQSMQLPLDDLMSFQGTIKVSGRPELILESA